jgi:hypothetical protein
MDDYTAAWDGGRQRSLSTHLAAAARSRRCCLFGRRRFLILPTAGLKNSVDPVTSNYTPGDMDAHWSTPMAFEITGVNCTAGGVATTSVGGAGAPTIVVKRPRA